METDQNFRHPHPLGTILDDLMHKEGLCIAVS